MCLLRTTVIMFYRSLTLIIVATGLFAFSLSVVAQSEPAPVLGILMPRASLSGGIEDKAAGAEILRQIKQDLNKKSIKFVELQSTEHAAAITEGRSRNCDYILEVSVSNRRVDSPRKNIGVRTASSYAFAGESKALPIEQDSLIIFDYKLISAVDSSIKSGSTLRLKNFSPNGNTLSSTIAKMADTIAAAVN